MCGSAANLDDAPRQAVQRQGSEQMNRKIKNMVAGNGRATDGVIDCQRKINKRPRAMEGQVREGINPANFRIADNVNQIIQQKNARKATSPCVEKAEYGYETQNVETPIAT